MFWCQGGQNISDYPYNRKLKSALKCAVYDNNARPPHCIQTDTDIQTDGRTNIMAIAGRFVYNFVLTNASRAKKKFLRKQC